MARDTGPTSTFSGGLRTVAAVVALAAGSLIGPLGTAAGANGPITCTDEDQLQPALDAANDGDTVTIAEGATCAQAPYFLKSGISITLVGAGTGATLDGDTGEGNARILDGSDVLGTRIRNLTFRNGAAGVGHGGAIRITGESSPVLENLTFLNNTAGDRGGAVSIQQASEGDDPVVITGSTFGGGKSENNATNDGGGLFVEADNDVLLTNSTFAGNVSTDEGGGAAIDTFGSLTATGNTFFENEASDNGGGIDVNADATVLRDNLFEGNRSFTEDGAGADVQGVDGGGTATISDNRFIDNTASESGGGLYVDVADSTLTGNTFTGNFSESADEFGDSGGGAYVNVNPDDRVVLTGNTFTDNGTFTEGGGLYIDLESNSSALLTRNTFTNNDAGRRGGGAFVSAEDDSTAEFDGNTFKGNSVTVGSCAGFGYGGGGLGIEGSTDAVIEEGGDGKPDITQRGNTFEENVVEPSECAQPGAVTGQAAYEGELHGGGEMLTAVDLFSVDDEFVANRVTNLGGGTEGGGISMRGDGTTREFFLVGHNLVLAANVLGGDGEGAGAYVGGISTIRFELTNATVTANRGVSAGAGLGGSDDLNTREHLVLRNSIVHGNTASDGGEANPDIDAFETVTVNFSDVCTAGLTLEAPSGNNICADPKLVDAADGDVHQTTSSPTLDAASDALVPSTLVHDYEGEARVQDALGDGPSPDVVDMGADELTEPAPPAPVPVVDVAAANLTAPGSIGEDDGYCLSARDGGVFTFGGCQFFGAASADGRNPNVGRIRLAAEDITAPQSLVKLNAPVISIAMVPADTGYWQAAEDGGVFSFGSAQFYGSMGSTPLTKPIVGIASSPTGKGYWLVASDGGVFSFGDAPFLGSTGGIALTKPIVGITATPTGKGYWLVASDGGVFSFGDAQFFGSTGGQKLNAPIVGMASRPGGLGYWLAAADGGVFTFGDAPFLGNRVGLPLNAPVIGIKGAASGNGYWLVAKDGGIFSYGSAPFLGSTGSMKLNQPVIDMTG